ncbi:MAG: ATP-grasp domain-containing protein [Burkholderiales bacterium]
MRRRVAIITDDHGWHGRQLRAAFAARGCDAVYVSLAQCRIDLARGPSGLVIPAFSKALPDGVFVRGVPGGTLEQVVLRLDVLHALRELGVPVYNDARAIERSVDKAMTSFLLKKAGLSTPQTWVCECEADARNVVLRETGAGRELVVKPLFGSQGAGLKRIANLADLPPCEEYNGVYYLQQFIDDGTENWHDWRVFTIGGRAVAGMLRRGSSWITNVAQGAKPEPVDLDEELSHLAEMSSRALEMDYAGVDVLRDAQGKRYVVEVNGIPAWHGLQQVCRFNLARRLVDDFIARRLADGVLAAV